MHHGKARINYKSRRGSQTITVALNKLHSSILLTFSKIKLNHWRITGITDLYFVLSAFRLKSLAQFLYPTVQMYDTAEPDKLLSDYQIKNAGNSQVSLFTLPVIPLLCSRNSIILPPKFHRPSLTIHLVFLVSPPEFLYYVPRIPLPE